MHRRGRELWATLVLCASLSGCANMRQNAPSPDLRPCTDGYAYTRDGWRLGVRHYRPAHPDPGKLPVILCHGLGLNASFWTITDNHLPAQLCERGYEVYVFDIRGSGENGRPGKDDRVNRFLRQTLLRERGESSWTVDDLVRYDVPAILDYVERETGQTRVNWVGHSLGGMMMFPFLELSTEPERIATFVGMGSTIIQAKTPQTDMLQANLAIRALLSVASAGRMGRPLTYFRMPGMGTIDGFYYTAENVDRRTISRFYGYTLEDPGPGALRQFAPYLRDGHLLSADRKMDYSARLGEVAVPALMVAGARPDLRRPLDPDDLRRAGQWRQDPVCLQQGKRPRGRLRPLRPGLEPLRPQGGLPGRDRLARPPAAGRLRKPPAASRFVGERAAVLVFTEPAEKRRCRFVTRSRTRS